MLLAPIVLVAALGQCPDPPSRYGPPPCAAANVPGCLPGYHRSLDTYGRTIFVCDVAARQAPPPAPAPQEPLAGPPIAETDSQGAPPPPFAATPQYAGRPPPEPVSGYSGRRGLLGLVLMPGASTVDRGRTGDATGAAALELRGPVGGARLRLGYEFSREVHAAEFGLKYDFLDRGPLRPFLAVGVGAASLAKDPGWAPSGSVSAGIDLYVVRDIFATLEVKQRAFTRDTPNGFDISSVHQTSFFAGVGFYF
jgi:hypothetical protein